MESTEAVSVIIPFYNRANYLKDALRSVFFQTAGDIQVILVDDGSTDDSLKGALDLWDRLIRGDEAADNRPQPTGSRKVIHVSLPHSGMPGLARNRGVAAAAAPLIAFLDSDDIWLPNKLEFQLPLHRGPDAVRISHTRERWLRASDDGGMGEVSQKSQKHAREGDIFTDALWKCIIGPSTAMMDRELFLELGGFREDLQVAEDYEFWLRVTARHPAGYINNACIEKRAGMPGQDQLSERYGQIEGFRIEALWGLINGEAGRFFTGDQQDLAWQVLAKKAGIYENGAARRSNREALEWITPIRETALRHALPASE